MNGTKFKRCRHHGADALLKTSLGGDNVDCCVHAMFVCFFGPTEQA